MELKITVLNDNTAGKNTAAEYGLSFLVESGNESYLFDPGPSDIALRNARMLEIDLDQKVETIVLTHGHWDHGNGLEYFYNKKLITHPNSFAVRYNKKNGHFNGLPLTKEEAGEIFELNLSKKPVEVVKDHLFLGEIPKTNDFEAKTASSVDASGHDDFIPDDSAVAVSTEKGLVVITGCSHSGICNIISYAKEVTGESKVHAVIGGFHLRKDDEVLEKTIAWLKNEEIDLLYPSHCTALPALAKMYEAFGIQQVLTGDVFLF
jgi:7,8-dihydropterin-6-yl-methyl-4-(beta-D-ribofuranosyl)aminobenzene 5'-phosphate synthase